MAKKVDGFIKLQIKAGQASPAPPIGPALGQKGVNIMEFCKAFITKSPPAAVLLKNAAKLKKGAADPLREKVAKVTWDQCRDIAEQKLEDLNATDLDNAARMIAGTARSMGITVIGDPAA